MMFIVIYHEIHDQQLWKEKVNQMAPPPQSLRRHQFLTASDLTKAACLWEAPSVDELRDYIDRRWSRRARRSTSPSTRSGRSTRWAPTPTHAPPCPVLNGDRDKAIPAWAPRLFTRWSRLPNTEVRVIPDAGHHLLLDQLDRCVPLIADWLDAHLTRAP